MRVVSQNGWPVLNADATTVISAGGRPWRLARGQVANVFKEFITRFHREVESIDPGQLDDWSWAVRTVRGSTTTISNHASGTAVDINALAHARGARKTFTRAEEIALHALLDDFPVVRWGGSFGTTVDEMHFEIAASPADLDTWLRTGTRPQRTATGALTPVAARPITDPEDDVPLTDADLARIADRVWNHAVSSASDPRGNFLARDRLAALDRTLHDALLPGLAELPEATARVVWDDTKVKVRHPRDDAEQSITMGTAMGRAASVIWDGKQAGVLHKSIQFADTTLEVVDDGSTATLQALLTQLTGIEKSVEDIASALLDPMPTAVAGRSDPLPAVEMIRQGHARSEQMVALISGVRAALDILAVAAAKGSLPEAEKLSTAMYDAMKANVPAVSPAGANA